MLISEFACATIKKKFGGVFMNNNGKRVLELMAKREVKNCQTEVSRNMTYSNGSWGDSHR